MFDVILGWLIYQFWEQPATAPVIPSWPNPEFRDPRGRPAKYRFDGWFG